MIRMSHLCAVDRMTKVFVHGNPETRAIWRPLTEALAKRGVTDVVTLSPPGFGAPVAKEFEPVTASYVAWLTSEVAAIDGPVDIIGHDWGAGHVFGFLAGLETGRNVRSWATDCTGILHPNYEWHAMAKVWATPVAGEAAVAATLAAGDAGRAAAYRGLGLPPDVADEMAAAYTPDMARCILSLYRAAAQPAMAQLGERVVAADLPPGLVIDATEDAYVPTELGQKMIEPLGAQRLELQGNGHWWMVEDPETAAEGLSTFWASLRP